MDLRFALRSLRRNPGFTLLAVLVMALGIGANTAMFSVVNAVLLKPLGYPAPDRIVVLSSSSNKSPGPGSLWKQVSAPDAQDWHDQSTAFQAMAYYATQQASVMAGSAAEYAQVTRVSPEFFEVFEAAPIAGRPLTSNDDVVISYAYWQTHFGGSASAVGRTIRMYDKSMIVAGVMRPGIRFPDKTDVWFPLIRDAKEYRSGLNYQAVARLKPQVTLEQAQAQMTSIAAHLEQLFPESNAGRSVTVTRLRDEMVSDVRLTLVLLLGAVGVVLLIACANTATLLLAKATARTREIAIRAAVGASRSRIVRQLIIESVVLALIAGSVGLALAVWGAEVLKALAPADVPRLADI